jgi:hypothetical protein
MAKIYKTASENNQSKENSLSKLSVNRRSVSIKKVRRVVEYNSESTKQSNIWNINSILANIFTYTDRKDLIEFNTVCKKWNFLTTPIIHGTIKLQRSAAIRSKIHGKSIKKAAIVNLEVAECIKNNSKHAKYLKVFKFDQKLDPQRAIEFFEAFKFITNLTIDKIKMSQDQLLGMINPLKYLEELNLLCLAIKWINSNMSCTNDMKLPRTLKKLSLEDINLMGNPQLFNQVINTHSNLVEFKFKMRNQANILKPFLKNYPSLEVFEYEDQNLGNLQEIVSVFESNPQLLTLKLAINRWNNSLANAIKLRLVNLENFKFIEPSIYHENRSPSFILTQHTKIKILYLKWDDLSQCSLNSILLNCPYLENLSLIHTSIDEVENPVIFLKLPKATNIKKLVISCRNLNERSLDTILQNCPLLKDLDIQLHFVWKDWMHLIGKRCRKLEHLKVSMSVIQSGVDPERRFQEMYQSDILINNYSVYTDTLISLTLNQFDFHFAKAEYFNSFTKLKYINFPRQKYTHSYAFYPKIEFDKDLWPNYCLNIKNQSSSIDVELIKLK